MANATARMVEETVVTTLSKRDGVVLELNEVEAQALAEVLGHVGGNPENTARRFTDSIHAALLEAGYHWSEGITNGSVYFKPDSDKEIAK